MCSPPAPPSAPPPPRCARPVPHASRSSPSPAPFLYETTSLVCPGPDLSAGVDLILGCLLQTYLHPLHDATGPPHEGVEQAFLDMVLVPNSHWLEPDTLLG